MGLKKKEKQHTIAMPESKYMTLKNRMINYQAKHITKFDSMGDYLLEISKFFE